MDKCYFCKELEDREVEARYDFRTRFGSWAFGCRVHYLDMRMHESLGVGKATELSQPNRVFNMEIEGLAEDFGFDI